MTRWTPELLDAVREKAAAGRTMAEAAADLGVSHNSLCQYAHWNGIRFPPKSRLGRPNNRPKLPATPKDVPLPAVERPIETCPHCGGDLGLRAEEAPAPVSRARALADDALRREIALARAEAPTAHLYRGGWPD